MQAQMNKIVISLTTVPERLTQNVEDGFKMVMKSICEQNYKNYEVHLNLPLIYNVTGEEYIIPQWLDEYQETYKHLKIFRTEDMGPPTKVIPTIIREDDETLLIVVDDDLIYHEDMILEHIKYHIELPNSTVLYDGRSLVTPKYGDLRDSWVLSVNEPLEVKDLQHYKSASYFVKYFESDFFSDFVGKTKSDDVLMSFYFKYKKIKMFVVPYGPDVDKLSTYDDWYKFQGVTTFPVLRHSNSVLNTGCNHPTMLEDQPRFFIPEEFKIIENPNYKPSDNIVVNTKPKTVDGVIKPNIPEVTEINNITDLIYKLAGDFNKMERKFWNTTQLTGEQHNNERSKPAPYIRKTAEIARVLGLKTLVEIGATRHGITPKCINYYYLGDNPFVSPPCCADGHGGIMFALEGFDVYSVDIDVNCSIHAEWSFGSLNRSIPENLHLNIPKDGIEFLKEFDKKIDILFLDGWDVGTEQYKEKHLESFEVSKDKLSDTHLILIDDTDFILTNEGKDTLLSPHLISLGYVLLFDGRQKLYINKI